MKTQKRVLFMSLELQAKIDKLEEQLKQQPTGSKIAFYAGDANSQPDGTSRIRLATHAHYPRWSWK